ncbi:sigma 54-interacting transcriptional regulator [Sporolactobacillus spathodeae]|uniref:Transcriptional regulatory protein LevR/transcriptional regulator with AAA-type ATPase domain n=1 Tax=Sporolactobacillus spathodeae TaxID=1465502 RepID=A0ABS2Q8F6_9BACL|nr:transcriptional regulatory protein LevR/transcriptional regulator with AAA-type ATPase domain [Sporolactobacillus spathodeae]
MKRCEMVYEALVKGCQAWTQEELLERSGVSAQEIAVQLGMLRSNVSSDLNELNRQQRVVKLVTRPVLYVPVEKVQELIGQTIPSYTVKSPSLKLFLDQKMQATRKEDPFTHLIGATESLQNSVKQAKSAIMYPPRGLHTLILGSTGSGKTLFAHMMHNYAKYCGRMEGTAPFIEFNCADYYNNPQLLIGQLFGYVKGAFTGAVQDQEGLVAKADKGILFLDEIHRLPPEGQEMLFYFMDTGRFSKLGEAGNKRHAQVLIIAATTADPESALLQTFLRRVPVMINVPPFHKRSVNEQVELTRFLLSREAHRTKHEFHVGADVVKALIGSVTFGNIGQLKSNVQLVCAQAFLDSFSSDVVTLDAKMLPPDMLDGLSRMADQPEVNQQLSKRLPTTWIITGEKDPLIAENDRYEPPFDMYQMITGQYHDLKEEGLTTGEIRKFITDDISEHVHDFYKQTTKDMLLSSVDKRILNFSKDITDICHQVLGKELSNKCMSLLFAHLSSFLSDPNRLNKNATTIDQSLLTYDQKDYEVAKMIDRLFQERLAIHLPEVELLYIAFLIGSFVELSRQKNVGIVVAAHGPHTASSMVSVAKELLGDHPLAAVDMPLNLNFGDIFDQIVAAVRAVDQGAGVLMMVDMGSLYYFEEKIAQKAHIEVRAVDMVSTPLILDAVKNANMLHMDLKSIIASLYRIREASSQAPKPSKSLKMKAILTICTTGSGIAQRIKTIVELFIHQVTEEDIEIIPVSINGLYEHAQKLMEKYDVVASIGAKNPRLENVPYITLSQFVSGDGQDILQSLFIPQRGATKESTSHIIVQGVCEDSLQDMLTYLNPKRAVDAIVEFNSALQNELKVHFKNATQIRIIMHMAFALEREVTKTPLKYEGEMTDDQKRIYSRLRPTAKIFNYKLNIDMSVNEFYYFVDMMIDELGKSVLLTTVSSK